MFDNKQQISCILLVSLSSPYVHDARSQEPKRNKYQVSHKHSCFSWWRAHSRTKHVEIEKCGKNKLCTKLVLFARLYRDARSTRYKI